MLPDNEMLFLYVFIKQTKHGLGLLWQPCALHLTSSPAESPALPATDNSQATHIFSPTCIQPLAKQNNSSMQFVSNNTLSSSGLWCRFYLIQQNRSLVMRCRDVPCLPIHFMDYQQMETYLGLLAAFQAPPSHPHPVESFTFACAVRIYR
jgi:hypothetical protein